MSFRVRVSRQAWLLLFLGCSAAFGANVSEVLHRAERAERLISYRGIKQAVVRCGSRNPSYTETKMSIVHLKPDKTRTAYLTPSKLSGTIVIRNGETSWRYRPQSKLWEHMGGCIVSVANNVSQDFIRNYQVRLAGIERIAGRDAYLVSAVPKSKGDPSHRFWIDRHTYLVLASETKTSSGKLLRSSRFLSIELNPNDISPSLFVVPNNVRRGDNGAVRLGFRVMKPSYLPKGYRLVGATSSCIGGMAYSHLRFSNGINTISLFQRLADKSGSRFAVGEKSTNVVTCVRNGVRCTIVGDLSRSELQKILASLR